MDIGCHDDQLPTKDSVDLDPRIDYGVVERVVRIIKPVVYSSMVGHSQLGRWYQNIDSPASYFSGHASLKPGLHMQPRGLGDGPVGCTHMWDPGKGTSFFHLATNLFQISLITTSVFTFPICCCLKLRLKVLSNSGSNGYKDPVKLTRRTITKSFDYSKTAHLDEMKHWRARRDNGGELGSGELDNINQEAIVGCRVCISRRLRDILKALERYTLQYKVRTIKVINASSSTNSEYRPIHGMFKEVGAQIDVCKPNENASQYSWFGLSISHYMRDYWMCLERRVDSIHEHQQPQPCFDHVRAHNLLSPPSPPRLCTSV
ncbi:hypothetical protein Syun_017297 [Stephania yunnanensis]|uniref:Uncharacterized protein n=1 Tax=Stephania yunnanensis TaxID=152371 RepID=A0AAP0P4W9_9MAGN